MDTKEFKLQLATDLNLLLDRPDYLGVIQEKYSDILTTIPIGDNLSHFFDDADIRADIPEYDAMQKNELKKFIFMLENDAGWDVLSKISFLQPSG
jgi:hypothetical protein